MYLSARDKSNPKNNIVCVTSLLIVTSEPFQIRCQEGSGAAVVALGKH